MRSALTGGFGHRPSSSTILVLHSTVIVLLSCVWAASESGEWLGPLKVKNGIQTTSADVRDSHEFILHKHFDYSDEDFVSQEGQKTLQIIVTDDKMNMVSSNGPLFTWALRQYPARKPDLKASRIFSIAFYEYKLPPSSRQNFYFDYYIFARIVTTGRPDGRIEFMKNVTKSDALHFRLRIVNSSLLRDPKAASQAETQISELVQPHIEEHTVTQQLQELLLSGMRYTINCTHAGNGSTEYTPSMQMGNGFKPIVISPESSYIAHDTKVKAFGDKIVQYDPVKKLFRLYRFVQSDGYQIIRGVAAAESCRKADMHEVDKNKILLVCEAELTTHFQLMTIYPQNSNCKCSNQSDSKNAGDLPVVLVDHYLVQGRYDSCNYVKDGNLLLCRTANNNGTFQNIIQSFFVYQEPLRVQKSKTITVDDVVKAYFDKTGIDLSASSGYSYMFNYATGIDSTRANIALNTHVMTASQYNITWIFFMKFSPEKEDYLEMDYLNQIESSIDQPTDGQSLCVQNSSVLILNKYTGLLIGEDTSYHKYFYDDLEFEGKKLKFQEDYCLEGLGVYILFYSDPASRQTFMRIYDARNMQNPYSRLFANITKQIGQLQRPIIYSDTLSQTLMIHSRSEGGYGQSEIHAFSLKPREMKLKTNTSGTYICLVKYLDTPQKYLLATYVLEVLSIGEYSAERKVEVPHMLLQLPQANPPMLIDLEQYYNIQGTYYESQLVSKSKVLKENQSIILHPRLTVLSHFEDPNGNSAFDGYHWLNENISLGTIGFQGFFLVRQERDPEDKSKPSVLYKGNYVMKSSFAFVNLLGKDDPLPSRECQAWVYDNPHNPSWLIFSTLTLAVAEANPHELTFGFKMTAVNMLAQVADPPPVVQSLYVSTLYSSSEIQQGTAKMTLLIAPSQDSPNESLLMASTIMRDTNGESLRIKTYRQNFNFNSSQFVRAGRNSSTFAFFYKKLTPGSDHFELKDYSLDGYLDNTTDVPNPFLLLTILTKRTFYMIALNATAVFENNSIFAVNSFCLSNFHEEVSSYNCSLTAGYCAFTFDNGGLVTVKLTRKGSPHSFALDISDYIRAGPAFPAVLKPFTNILITESHLAAYNSVLDDGVLVYKVKDGSISANPHVVLRRDYQDDRLIKFTSAWPTRRSAGSVPQELLVVSSKDGAGLVYSITSTVLEIKESALRSLTATDLNSTYVLLNYPQSKMLPPRANNPVSISLPFALNSRTSIAEADPGKMSRSLTAAFVLLLALLVFVLVRILMYVKYQLKSRENTDLLLMRLSTRNSE